MFNGIFRESVNWSFCMCSDMQLERKISVKKKVGPPVAVKKRISDVENQPISGKFFIYLSFTKLQKEHMHGK